MILSCNKIKKNYGAETILDDVTFNLEDNEKMAIVGVNGAGKTTLFKILIGEISKDGGDFSFAKNSNIGYIAQINKLIIDKSVYDVVLEAFNELIDLEQQLNELQYKINMATENESIHLADKYSKLNEKYVTDGGYLYKSLVKGALIGLGFTEDDFSRNYNTLSGGEKTRVHLAKLLVSNNDILLLDEPTNHLDIKAIQWLENYLKNYKKAVVIISHDRYFLDNIVTKIIEIEHKKSKVYNGNFTDYSVQKEINREIELAKYLNQQKEKVRQEEVIRTLKSYNREKSVKRARSREKALSKMELLDKPLEAPSTMKFEITPLIQSGNDVLQCIKLKKSYENDDTLFINVDFNVYRGDKIAVIGDNGAGKSTLIKIITNQIEATSGEVNLGTNVNIGYYDQENTNLDERLTIFEEIHNANPKLTNTEIRNTLATFVFTGDDVHKKIGSLSGGEKGRVSLCKLMLSSANLLILDEPTNHLDMFSKEILENAINCYEGTVIYISHDRYFINNTAQKIFRLHNKNIDIYNGSYDDYIETLEKSNVNVVQYNNIANTNNETISTKLDYKQQKELQAQDRKKKKEFEKLEARIEELEALIIECDEIMATEEVYTNSVLSHEYYDKKVSYENELEAKYELWSTFN